MKNRSGFTLIELSIVLVIIGLVAGGVFVGRDMIKTAEIRATAAQPEQFKVATNAFRLKYNGLPGDLSPSKAQSFGLYTFTGNLAGSPGFGDENGLIDWSSESLMFWRQLSDSGLVNGTFGSIGNSLVKSTNGRPTGVVTNFSQSVPLAKIGRNHIFIPASSRITYVSGPLAGAATIPDNFYTLSMLMGLSNTLYWDDYGLTPLEAFTIDSKLDDGKPLTGSVKMDGQWGTTGASGLCIKGGTNSPATDGAYNIDPSVGGNTPACLLYISF